jgi:hypothetical protein
LRALVARRARSSGASFQSGSTCRSNLSANAFLAARVPSTRSARAYRACGAARACSARCSGVMPSPRTGQRPEGRAPSSSATPLGSVGSPSDRGWERQLPPRIPSRLPRSKRNRAARYAAATRRRSPLLEPTASEGYVPYGTMSSATPLSSGQTSTTGHDAADGDRPASPPDVAEPRRLSATSGISDRNRRATSPLGRRSHLTKRVSSGCVGGGHPR